MNLTYLLGSIKKTEFFENYWEKRLLYLNRHDKEYYRQLFNIADLDKIIAANHLRYPSLKLSRDGRPLDKSQFTHQRVARGGDEFEFEIDIEAVHDLYSKGATIRLIALEKNWMPTINLRQNLEAELGHEVQINAYLTPPDAQGIALHYDPHDVIVLQVYGQKNWLVYDSPYELPLPSDRVIHHPEIPLIDTTLDAGDFLYIPRGFYHVAKTTTHHSLHLTVGLKVFRVIDAVKHCLDHVILEKSQNVEYRRSLPPDLIANKDARNMAIEMLKNALEDLINELDPEESITNLIERFEQTRPKNGKLFFEDKIIGDN